VDNEILIVEDEKIVALDIKTHLLKLGYQVAGSFGHAEEALEFLETHHVNLVLMDIHLQGKMDGVEAAHNIKERWDIPVIMLTAFADENTIARSKRTEPFGYIIKPFHERELRTAIEMALYRYQMGKALKERERLFSTTLASIADGVVVTDETGKINYLNRKAEELASVDDWYHKELDMVFPKLKLDEGPEIEMVNRFGMTKQISRKATDLEDQNHKVGQVWALHDITNQRELEKQLRHSQKMEAIGRLAGGVAHDFNNILTVIMGYCTLILDDEKDQNPYIHDVQGIQSAAKKAVNLTRQLLLFSRQQQAEKEVIDLNGLIKGLEKMLRRLITEDISIHLRLQGDGTFLMADPGQLEQVLINLVVNARDALPEGGRISISTERFYQRQEEPTVSGLIPKGEYARILVEDNGIGMSPSLQTKVFEPFFTTKEEGQGTGLGLSTVFGILRQHKGFIQLKSTEGHGTVFSLYFPLLSAEELPEKNQEEIREPVCGSETIMIVEDDHFVLHLMKQVLDNCGYEVLEATNGGDALVLLETHGDKVDLIITDVVMPHMNGDVLQKRIQDRFPHIPFLFITGYPEKTLEEKHIDLPGEQILHKPFQANQLLNKVTELL